MTEARGPVGDKCHHQRVVGVGGSLFPFEKFLSAGQSAVVRGQHEIWNFVGKFVTSRMLIKKVSVVAVCLMAAGWIAWSMIKLEQWSLMRSWGGNACH